MLTILSSLRHLRSLPQERDRKIPPLFCEIEVAALASDAPLTPANHGIRSTSAMPMSAMVPPLTVDTSF
jgi:hypothetical protein